MKELKKYLFFAVFSFLTPWMGAQASAGSEAADARLFVLSDGSVSVEDVEAIKAFATKNLALAIDGGEVELSLDEGVSLSEVAEAAEAVIHPEALATVLFSGEGSEEDSHTLFIYDKHLAVIHVSKVLEGAEGTVAFRRLERLAMRGFGFLLEQQPAIDPFSVMAPYQTLEQLDRMGRNFSPPDLVKLQKHVRSLGLDLVEDSPYNLAPESPKE